MGKKKKKKKKGSQSEATGVHTTAAGDPEATDEELGYTAPRTRRKSGAFFWGLSAGFVVTLALIVANDLGWQILPQRADDDASRQTANVATVGGHSIVVAGRLPEGARVYVDGKAATTRPGENGIEVDVDPSAGKLEVRGQQGTWWSTSLAAAGDTVRPALTGDIVVEVQRQAPAGDLYMDGELVGTAPGAIAEVPAGWHHIEIRQDEKVLYADACTVTPGEVTLLNVLPYPPHGKGRLIVRARQLEQDGFRELEGRTVWVDGERVDDTPTEINLMAGFHSVRVEHDRLPPRVEVVYLEAGRTLYVHADFGRQRDLEVQVSPPVQTRAGEPVALAVRVRAGSEHVMLEEGHVHVIREDQMKPVSFPLVPSGTDPDLFLALIPRNLARSGVLTGYASCEDDEGRSGHSELFSLALDSQTP